MKNQTIIDSYSLDEAITDGVLVVCFRSRWKHLSGGKPIVATAAVSEDISQAALIEIWNDSVRWRREVMETLPEEEQHYATTMNGKTIWVMEDGQAFTFLYPEDY